MGFGHARWEEQDPAVSLCYTAPQGTWAGMEEAYSTPKKNPEDNSKSFLAVEQRTSVNRLAL